MHSPNIAKGMRREINVPKNYVILKIMLFLNLLSFSVCHP